ncbi:MAG: hypothetical protein AB1540_14385 [Bdellovibrionota bacterium]
MKNHLLTVAILMAIATPMSFAQYSTEPSQDVPPIRAEDPAYLDEAQTNDQFTEEEVIEEDQLEAETEVVPSRERAPASEGSPSTLSEQAPLQPEQEKSGSPMFLDQLQSESKSEQPKRSPASSAGTSETEQAPKPQGTQLSFFEISPVLGSISIEDKAAFSVGTNLSFRVAKNFPFYFEPSLYLSFLSGDNDVNATIFHVDGGLRYDWIISESPIVPFVKAAVGPSFSSSDNVVVNGENISDSYFNAFLGGGLKLLINENIAARADTGVTFQGTDPGLFVFGSVVLPL